MPQGQDQEGIQVEGQDTSNPGDGGDEEKAFKQERKIDGKASQIQTDAVSDVWLRKKYDRCIYNLSGSEYLLRSP